ncbi:glycosyltransferase family protein [Geobacter sulfurreducens]|uniref:glycosyltransferase family protein n=1 Tax=Geobacter sulfurreducens TaxID=35554 RepID=UPI0020B7B879|nr:glycosyltransferase [Geobacter sulfurreducens]UTG91411.1 glycosyltransferase [Geobacter sulfurreducens]
MLSKQIWITWENQVRNRAMSSMLGSSLYVFNCTGGRVKRYVICCFKTISTLWKEKPAVVYSQNPSIVLVLFLLMMRPIFRYKLVSDAHYAGVVAFNGNKLFQSILNICNRMVDMVIVTNSDHARFIHDVGGKAVVCEDPLPDLTAYTRRYDDQSRTVFFICSYDVDEPYKMVFEAANLLAKEGFTLCVTGNYVKAHIDPKDYPAVSFLGYLPEAQYYEQLMSSSIVLDLTENENCLVCGAYEAMSAGKPLITSNTSSLRSFFTKGTVFTDHNVDDLIEAVKVAYKNRQQLSNDIVEWKEWAINRQAFNAKQIFEEIGIDCV